MTTEEEPKGGPQYQKEQLLTILRIKSSCAVKQMLTGVLARWVTRRTEHQGLSLIDALNECERDMGYDDDDALTVTVACRPQTSPINIPRLPGSRPGLIRFGPHRPTADSPGHTPRASRPSSPHNHPSFALTVDRFTDFQLNIPSIDAERTSSPSSDHSIYSPRPPSLLYNHPRYHLAPPLRGKLRRYR